MKLYLVRHGQTDLNKERRYQGRIDIALNNTGLEQVKKLSARLSSEPLNKVFTSPLERAHETASIIHNGRNIDLTSCADLVEMDFGQLEGKTYEEIIKIFPDWESSNVDFAFVGGECIDALVGRTGNFVNTLVGQPEDSNILIVSHSGCLRILLCLILGIDVAKWWQFKVDQAALTVIEYFPQSPVLVLFNDTSHLSKE
ncbi:MAG: alpha-ribazole phosphatase [Dehalococcoidales bacterium]|nr:alpha-ribazole phosphatase [Dehalococcoidales bacterium]